MMLDKPITVYHVDNSLFELEKFQQTIKYLDGFIHLGSNTKGVDAVKAIRQLQPDIVFADIDMPKNNGFWLAEQLKDEDVLLVFLTTLKDKALKPFEISALQYILKPCSIEDLQRVRLVYAKMFKHVVNSVKKKKLSIFNQDSLQQKPIPKRIIVNNIEKTNIIAISELSYAKSKGSYTCFKMIDGTEVLSSKNIKVYNDILMNHPDIIRVHRAVLVNKNFVKAIRRDKHLAYVQLSTGQEVEISLYRKDEVIKELIF